MLDVHPPEHTPHTWRDFFIHIATIVVGLVIAVGLEQTVEFIHHRHQATALRATLQDESAQVVHDATGMVVFSHAFLAFLDQQINATQTAYFAHKGLASIPRFDMESADSPDVPQWRAAKQSGLILNLTQGEITAYSEIEYLQTMQQEAVVADTRDNDELQTLLRMYPERSPGHRDLSQMSPEDMHALLKSLAQLRIATMRVLEGNLLMIGAEGAVQHGERRLPAIYRAESHAVRADPEFAHKP